MNPYSPYYIGTESKSIRAGAWSVTECTVWDKTGGGKIQIGRYQYDYHSCARDIFYPFKQDDQWYALYSTHYETIALMTLPDCKVVELTEESKKNLHGFCPVESWVLAYKRYLYDLNNGTSAFIYLSEDEMSDQSNDDAADYGPIQYHSFAFVAGCVWGDDSSMKVNMLDLSRIKEGILKYVDYKGSPWSYLELPRNLPLNKAIHIEVWDDPNKPRFWWATPRIIDYKDGQLTDFV